MINIECPTCQSKLAIKEMYSGKVVLCPKCKGKMRIPHLDAEVEEEAPEQRVATSRADTPRPRQRVEEFSERTSAPPKRRPVDDDDEEDDDRPRRRRGGDEDFAFDDESPPPRRRKKRRRRRRRRESESWSLSDVDWGLWMLIGLGVIALIGFGGAAGAIAFPPLMLLPILLGLLMVFVGYVWFMIIAFQDDVVQGCLCLFIGIYRLYYTIVNFDEVKVPFLIEMVGVVMVISGACAGGAIGHRN
jgi:hypothetical protein